MKIFAISCFVAIFLTGAMAQTALWTNNEEPPYCTKDYAWQHPDTGKWDDIGNVHLNIAANGNTANDNWTRNGSACAVGTGRTTDGVMWDGSALGMPAGGARQEGWMEGYVWFPIGYNIPLGGGCNAAPHVWRIWIYTGTNHDQSTPGQIDMEVPAGSGYIRLFVNSTAGADASDSAHEITSYYPADPSLQGKVQHWVLGAKLNDIVGGVSQNNGFVEFWSDYGNGGSLTLVKRVENLNWRGTDSNALFRDFGFLQNLSQQGCMASWPNGYIWSVDDMTIWDVRPFSTGSVSVNVSLPACTASASGVVGFNGCPSHSISIGP